MSRVFARTVNVRNAKGLWTPIDPNLVAQRDGSLINGDAGFGLRLPATLDGPVKLADGGDSISLELQGAGASPAKVGGATATYEGAGDGVQAQLTSTPSGLKEDLILNSAASQAAFTYDVSLSSGLKLKANKSGGIDVVDASGDVAFAVAAPIAADAGGAGATGELATMTTDGDTITVELSKDWLSDPDRQFPVTLDPSVYPNPTQDCTISPTGVNSCTSASLIAGNGGGGDDYRALLQFNPAAVVPKGVYVQEAAMKLYAQVVSNPGVSNPVSVRRVTSAWDNSATWTKRTASANWATAGGDLDSTVTSTQPIPAEGAWSAFDVTDTVTAWLNGNLANNGVELVDSGTADNFVAYSSSNAATNYPYLEIEYFNRVGNLPGYTIDSEALTDRSSIGVNVANGNLIVSSQDLQVAAKALPVSIARTYNSGDSWSGQVGIANRFSVGRDFVLYKCDPNGARCLIGPSGFRARFSKNAGGSYNTPPGIGNWTLSRATPTAGSFTLRDNGSGTQYGFFDNDYSFVEQITARHGEQMKFRYTGPAGSLDQITDTNDRTYPVTADSAGRITSIAVPAAQFGPDGILWQYTYDASGRLWKVTDPESKVTTYVYGTTAGANDYGLLKKITDPRGKDTLITYDSAFRVNTITRVVDGTTANDITTTYTYTTVLGGSCTTNSPPAGIVGQTSIIDPLSHGTNYCWNQDGSVLRTRNALGQDTATSYTPEGNVGSIKSNPNGTGSVNAVTTYGYGAGGTTSNQNLTSITSPVSSGKNTTTSATYKAGGTSDPLQQYRLDEVTDAQGKITRYDYTNGDVTNIKNAGGTVAADPGTSSAQFSWYTVSNTTGAAKGELEWSQVAGDPGRRTTYLYDPKGRLTTVDPPGNLLGNTTYTYDGLSRVISMTDGRGKTTSYGYDDLGRQTSVTDAGGVIQTFGYDGNGNLTGRTEPGKSSSYGFDNLNRPTSENVPGNATQYTWDKASNLKTMTDYTGPSTYGYDNINRLTSLQAPAVSGLDTTTFGYVDPTATALGYSTQTLPGGGTIKTTQDLSGKTTEVLVKDNAGVQSLKRTYGYAAGPAEQELLATASEQATTADPITNRVYSYDDTGQLIEVDKLDAAMNVTSSLAYSYDAAGNRASRINAIAGGGGSYRSYAYRPDNVLCWKVNALAGNRSCSSSPGGETKFTYDAAGNELTGDVTSSYDDKGRLATLNGANLTNLAAGNTDVTAIGATSYRNTLLGTTWISASGNISKIQRDVGGSAVSQIRDGAKRWFVQDQIGSTIALIDTNGVVQRIYTYDPDGVDTTVGSGPATWIRYAGGVDTGSGLYHFANRYYQPSTARWTQQDPLSQVGDLQEGNRYTYVGSDPTNRVDPSGLLGTGCADGSRYAGNKANSCTEAAARNSAAAPKEKFNAGCAADVFFLTTGTGAAVKGIRALSKVGKGYSAAATAHGTYGTVSDCDF